MAQRIEKPPAQVDANVPGFGVQILKPLPQTSVPSLLEFAKFISNLEVDYVIFMARKAMRLYDLLLAAGCNPPKSAVITDQILDQSLPHFREKRVALVDDTLILGTTLAEAEAKLLEKGVAEVKTYVFALDVENWCKELMVPNRFFCKYSSQEMLTFCAMEVKSLALAGIPYLTEFPISRTFRLSKTQFPALYSMPSWDSFLISDQAQEEAGVYYYSHLPTEDCWDDVTTALGDLVRSIDICKVRTFVKETKNAYYVRSIPIATLKPVSEEKIGDLFTSLLANISVFSERDKAFLNLHLNSAKAQVKFIQYTLSAVLGEIFNAQLLLGAGLRDRPRIDLNEASRSFGPWLRPQLKSVHLAAVKIADGMPSGVKEVIPEITQVPSDVLRISKEDYHAFVSNGAESRTADIDVRNVFSDLVRAFVQLHKKYELPAREEARRLGKEIFSATPREAPFRDRLKIGFAWTALAEALAEREGIAITHARSMRLTLFLDALVDLGIAVPILVSRNGILFRAYRHGEDAPFAEQEHALAYEAAAGFLEASGRAGVPRLTFEKLLIAMLRVGMKKGFLEAFHGLSGSDRVARIAFHRHGAVATLGDNESIFADGSDIWLSNYLVRMGVFTRSEGGGYALGERPQAALISGSALTEARQLGWLVGRLARHPGSGETPVLDENSLAILTTCCQPRDATAAALAELRIFNQWLSLNEKRLKSVDWGSPKACDQAIQDLVRSNGYAALNSARLKLYGYWTGRPAEIVREGAERLRSGPEGAFLAAHWLGSWDPVLAAGTEEQAEKFDPWILRLGEQFLQIAVGVFSMEMALASAAQTSSAGRSRRFQNTCAKVVSYLEAMAEFVTLSSSDRELVDRLIARAKKEDILSEPEKVYDFGLNTLRRREHVSRGIVPELRDIVKYHGRVGKRSDFVQSLWYDIIDSTGEKSGKKSEELSVYRHTVSIFKKRINHYIFGLMRDAQRRGAEVAVDPGGLDSHDDEKTLFFSGVSNQQWMFDALHMMLDIATSLNIRVRVLLINANFAGSAPHRFRGDPDIIGLAYYEYRSRIIKNLRQIELQLLEPGLSTLQHSVVWLGDELAASSATIDRLRWRGLARSYDIEVDLDDRPISTTVHGGLV